MTEIKVLTTNSNNFRKDSCSWAKKSPECLL